MAGVVAALGDGVTGLAVGDEVLGISATPAYAEQALAQADALVRKPATVPWEVAGSLAGPGGTAVVTLEKLAVGAGETLLVHAAAGGVGVIASQLAVARGARVIGTASDANHALLRGFGVEPVRYGAGLVERVLGLAPRGVDAVLDASGRGELAASVELAGGTKRVLTIAGFEEAPGLGVQVHVGGGGAETPRALGELLALIEAGTLVVPIAKTYPLTDAAAALRASEAGHFGGKLVLLPR
jgi:NADPH:quinone reductase-like Zn-dependent oxidoreductase